MIRLLGDFLFFVSLILGILLIIGLIKPSLVSNIMKRLPDPIGEFLEKVTNRKKVLLVYGASCVLLMIIGPTLSPVEHFETGKKYYEKEDWAGAVNNLSKVSTDDENYAEALELLSVAKENRTREQAEEKKETPADDSETQGTTESKPANKKSNLTQLLHEYGDLLDDYADIMAKVSEGDMSAMSEMTTYLERVTEWTEKWGKELEASQDDLSPSELADIMKEYQRLLERYQEIASNM